MPDKRASHWIFAEGQHVFVVGPRHCPSKIFESSQLSHSEAWPPFKYVDLRNQREGYRGPRYDGGPDGEGRLRSRRNEHGLSCANYGRSRKLAVQEPDVAREPAAIKRAKKPVVPEARVRFDLVPGTAGERNRIEKEWVQPGAIHLTQRPQRD